jgi:hypothetical protein
MTFKDLLVVVDSSTASDNRVELAASLAAKHGAHLIGFMSCQFLNRRLLRTKRGLANSSTTLSRISTAKSMALHA